MSKRICNIHGIWEKTEKQTKCPLCAKQVQKEYDEEKRNKSTDRFYHSARWKEAREKQLTLYPLCAVCQHQATVVDHIIEIKDGGSRLSPDNLQSLCASCHNIKTAQEKAQREGRVKSLQTKDGNTDALIQS